MGGGFRFGGMASAQSSTISIGTLVLDMYDPSLDNSNLTCLGISGSGKTMFAQSFALKHIAKGGRLNNIARHILGLYHGEPGARAFRRHLSENAVGAGADLLAEVRAMMSVRQRPESRTAVATAE